MVPHNHVDGEDTRFSTMSLPLIKSIMENRFGVTRRGSYQEPAKGNRWSYELVSDLWPDKDRDSDSSVDGSSDEIIKDQEKFYDHEQEVVSVPCSNPRRIRRFDQRPLRQLKS